MNSRDKEIVDILQEECAEVIQVVSKCRRFGIDMSYHEDGETNRQRLTKEVGDLQRMIDLLIQFKIVDAEAVNQASEQKAIKLRTWSSIYS